MLIKLPYCVSRRVVISSVCTHIWMHKHIKWAQLLKHLCIWLVNQIFPCEFDIVLIIFSRGFWKHIQIFMSLFAYRFFVVVPLIQLEQVVITCSSDMHSACEHIWWERINHSHAMWMIIYLFKALKSAWLDRGNTFVLMSGIWFLALVVSFSD